MRKIILKTFVIVICCICLNTTNSHADTVIREMTNNTDHKQINYGIVEKKSNEVTKTDSLATKIYNTLSAGREYYMYKYYVASSPLIFCNDIRTGLKAEFPYHKIDNKEWLNRAEVKWTLAAVATGKLGNSGRESDFMNLPGQIALWWLHSDATRDLKKGTNSYKTAMEAFAYANYDKQRQSYKAKSGNDYKYPEVKQTEPENEKGLVGPYQIDYMYGEYITNGEEYYVAGIEKMILKNEKGEEIKHIDEANQAKDAYWYIADKNGAKLNNGAYGNKPKPNQEFYIKLVNFAGGKAYVSFKIKKIEIISDYITASGREVEYIQGVLCENCWATRTKWLWLSYIWRRRI